MNIFSIDCPLGRMIIKINMFQDKKIISFEFEKQNSLLTLQ